MTNYGYAPDRFPQRATDLDAVADIIATRLFMEWGMVPHHMPKRFEQTKQAVIEGLKFTSRTA